ncbi:gamma-mobile-trio integrase GmtZ [Hydrogenophaga sp.]|uniref:gamma-mobile-trio integrase GmtZ n=1 Tax=Hydrogenophaga sp. TaxID=1904254 RepID=UPI002FCC446D
MTRKKYCEVGNLTEVVSPLTNNRLWVNMSDSMFQLPADVPVDRVRATASPQEEYWKKLGNTRTPSGLYREALLAFNTVQTVEMYRRCIDVLIFRMREVDEQGTQRTALRGMKARGLDLLVRLWADGLLGWPTRHPFESVPHLNFNDFTLLHHMAWFSDVRDASASKTKAVKVRCASIVLRSAMTTVGVRELGDLTPASIDPRRWDGLEKSYFTAVKALMTAQKLRYGEAIVFPSLRWAQPLAQTRREPSHGAQDLPPELEAWGTALTSWIQASQHDLRRRRAVAGYLVSYVRALNPMPIDPTAYCRRDQGVRISFPEWLDGELKRFAERHRTKLTNLAREFFAWWIETVLTIEDDFGRPMVHQEYWNPVPRLRMAARAAQTHREAMPTRYIRELVAILTEDDFAWGRKALTDYFAWFNPSQNGWERLWSPVRVICLLVKLHLPLRTFQVRMLDSGEFDHEVYRKGEWTRNEATALTGGSLTAVRRGVLRRFEDRRVGRTFTGFFINTNKTADRLKDPDARGYEIPWQNDAVIAYLEMLRDWQARHNMQSAPLAWSEVNERELLAQYSLETLRQRGEVSFLFRDPCGPDRRYPMRASKVASMWNLLLDELERRVYERGERLPDGGKICFVKVRDATGRATAPVYDLHTLRVSLLTAYATEGGVPIEILSKCVAGHASLLMTIYYIKTGPAYMTEQLALAQERILASERENLKRFMVDATLDQLEDALAFNDGAGTKAVLETSPGSWVIGDKGICPVGGSLCGIGGPKATNIGSRSDDHMPVPGGPKNCVRCRFFITGPAFLGGLVAHFNAVGLKLTEVSARYQDLSARIKEIEDEMSACSGDGASSATVQSLDLAHERQDAVMQEVDELATNWHAAYRLVERSRTLAVPRPGSSTVSLVLAGSQRDLEVAIEMTTDFEVINAVCQVAQVYPSEDSTLANLRRSRLLDAMLLRSGCKPVFATLSDAEALGVGNEFVSFLVARLGRVETTALMEGRRMLSGSGVVDEASQFLAELTRAPIRLSTIMDERRAASPRLESGVA